jgi:hypothetical protein
MDALDEAVAVVRTAEQELRAILVQAAKVGDYGHVPRIAEWAKLLSTLSGQPLTELEPAPSDDGTHNRPPTVRARVAAEAPRKARTVRRQKSRRGKRAMSEYPKFVREGDSLVKIGWSRREGKPYEHKAPRRVLRTLVQALVRVGVCGQRFTVDGILPLKDGGTEIPDYQTYLTLAWLRSVGLLTQHGRQGYSLPEGTDLSELIGGQWDSLPAR